MIVRGKHVALPTGLGPASVWIERGRITRIEAAEAPGDGRPELDAGELWVMPGLVDTHVHINDPGRADWEGFATATRAAAAGGITTLVDMPLNSIPPTTNAAGVAAKLAALEGNAYVDVGFCGGLVPENAKHLDSLLSEGVLAVKCFTCESGVAEFPHVLEEHLLDGLRTLGEVPLFVHAEMPAELLRAEAALGDPTPETERTYARWLASRPAAAEDAAIAMVLAATERRGARAHIVHLSAASALHLLERARDRHIALSAETCPHYLSFAAEDIPDGATAFKCAPPIREQKNREKLWDALRQDLLAQVVTDHSPSTLALKCSDTGSFTRAWGGISSLEIGFSVLMNQLTDKRFGALELLEKMSAAPARLVNLQQRKGRLQIGGDADFFLWDPKQTRTVHAQSLQHKNPITPYEGRTLRGRVTRTFLRGEEIYRLDGERAWFSPPRGQWLRR